MTTTTDPTEFEDLVVWLVSQPEHQPTPRFAPRTLPPTQPSPLISGLLEAVLTNSPSVPLANVQSKLIGTNNNPLTTNPPIGPSLSETLVVQTTAAPSGQHRTNTGSLSAPTGGAAVPATPIFTPAATGTQIVTLVLSLIPTDATTETPYVVATVAAGATIVPFVLGLGSPLVLPSFNGPITSTNVTLAIAARAAAAPGCQIYWSVLGIDV